MAKYEEAFKRQVVQEYLTDRIGTGELSQKYEIGRSVLRRWISAWQHHGESGLRKKREAYSAEFKLAVMQRMWRDVHGARAHTVNSPNMALAGYATGLLGGKNYDIMAL